MNYPPPPPYPPYPPARSEGSEGGRIELNLEFNPLQIFLHGITPRVVVNGHPLAARWGRIPFDMPAGNHLVACSFPYLLSDYSGAAQMMVPVHPGYVTVVSYQTPFLMFMNGSIRVVSTLPMMAHGYR